MWTDTGMGETDRVGRMLRKDDQVHRLRGVFRQTEVGQVLDELFTVQMPRLSQAVFGDQETYGMLLALLRPWLFQDTVYEMLNRELDSDSAERLREIVERVSESQPQLRGQLDAVVTLVVDHVGSSLKDLLKAPVPQALTSYRSS